MRYPYVFVSSYKDGIDVFDISDPENPEGVAYFDTYFGKKRRAWPTTSASPPATRSGRATSTARSG
jgi:hypothetical protein